MKLEDFNINFNDDKYTALQAIEQITKITKKALQLDAEMRNNAIDDDFSDDFDDEDFVFVASKNTDDDTPYFAKHMAEIVSELFALTSAINTDRLKGNFFENYKDIIAKKGNAMAVYESVIANKRNKLGQYIDPLEMIKTAVFVEDSKTQVSIQHIAQAIHECA